MGTNYGIVFSMVKYAAAMLDCQAVKTESAALTLVAPAPFDDLDGMSRREPHHIIRIGPAFRAPGNG